MEVTDDALRAYVGARALLAIFVYSSVIGIFGNVWYYRLTVRRIEGAANGATPEALARLGGTSWPAVLGGLALLFVVLIALAVVLPS